MTKLNTARARQYLNDFDFRKLFIEELGWHNPPARTPQRVSADGVTVTAQPIAGLSGVLVLEVQTPDGILPDAKLRRALQTRLREIVHENIVIFVDGERARSVWQWVRQEGSKAQPRTHHYVRGQSGDLMLSKLGQMFVDFNELDAHGNLPLSEAAARVRSALDIAPVTRRFYDEFQQAHTFFLDAIAGIGSEPDRRWYTSVILNRLMFVYFLQKKGFIDGGDLNYLQNKLAAMQRRATDRYYADFLLPLFFDGFALPEDLRTPATRALLGNVRYLNGGLFLRHPVEERWPRIAIPDVAFERLFALFERYSWNLDDSIGGADDEINPDVLGYIFEKYINQKAFGAYYTPPEITRYLCAQTVEQLVVQQLAERSAPLPGQPAVTPVADLGELYERLDGRLASWLIGDGKGNTGILAGLRLLDPACGSGAFLVAALETLLDIYRAVVNQIPALDHSGLTAWLADVRQSHPSEAYYLKKRIITDNLYGVDIMPEAVEIARLRLFLALVASARRVEDLEPLPNIDFNILPGNSLIGLLRVDEARFAALTPAAAAGSGRQMTLTPTARTQSMFDKLGTSNFRSAVNEKTQKVLRYRNAADYADLRGNSTAVTALRDDIEALRAKHRPTLDTILLEQFKDLKIQYEQATWDAKSGKPGKPKKRDLTARDVSALQPFHWGYEFDEVMNGRGGFDAIITNPPWEVWKPQGKEFFVDYAPDSISKNKMRIEEFEAKQDELLRQPDVLKAWLDYLSRFPHLSSFFRSAAQYEHQSAVVGGRRTGSDLNLYKLFTEQCFNLLRAGGLCGIVIPSGIYTDLGATGLRQMLFEKTQIQGLFGFENRRMIFEGVDSRFKFVVLTFEKGGATDSFPATFMRHDVADLAAFPANALDYSVALVRRMSPEPLSLMEFNDARDVQIARKLLRFPLLGDDVPGAWSLSFTREFDMTNNSDIFETAPAPGRLPLYEGKMIHQFEHQFAEPRYWVDERNGRAAIVGKRGEDNGQRLDYQAYRLGWRDVAASTNERTFIATIIPPAFHGNKIPTVKIFDDDGRRMIDEATQLYLCAVWNSFVCDWQIRQKVTTTLNYFYLYQLALPRLTAADAAFRPLVTRAARLICTTPAYDALAAAVGLGSHRAGATDAAERAQLRAELDALVARLYGLDAAEFAYILDSFPLVDAEVKAAALRAFRERSPEI